MPYNGAALATVHKFGDFELDETLYELRKKGGTVKIEPKVFDVLAYLLRHRDRVVSKDELLDELWPGNVSESVLPRCITAARRALEDDSNVQAIIQTVRRRGYRFVAAVHSVEASRPGPATPAQRAAAAAVTARDPAGVFVGRQHAVAQLQSSLDKAMGGHGQVALLVGEPGIGKTRTASHLAAQATAAGARVLTGRCYEGEGAPAFWPWVQILRACIEELGAQVAGDGPRASDIATLVPDIRGARPELAEPENLAPEQARFRLFDSVTSFLRERASSNPLVLIVDDLHWADKPSLRLLQFLASAIVGDRILVLGTYRDVHLSRSDPLAEMLGTLAREPICRRIDLDGLEESDVQEFIEATAGKAAVPELCGALHRITEGNPFFIEEMIRLLVAVDRLDDPDAIASLGLPPGVRAAVGRHVAALSQPCNRVLTVGAVIGREWSTAVLERTLVDNEEPLLEILDEAVRARVLHEVPGTVGRYAFGHALIRETLYEDIPTPQRVELHRRVGAALEEVHRRGLGAYVPELAHHYFQGAAGGDADKAIQYGVAAAQRSWGQFAYEDAATLYERVLETLDLQIPIDEAKRCEVLLRLGEAHARSGETKRSRRAFRQAADLARALGRPDDLARAALGFGSTAFFGMPRDDELVALLEESLRELGNDNPTRRAQLLSVLAITAPNTESLERRQELSEQAVELARNGADGTVLADALVSRYWSLAGPDHLDERERIGDELLALHAATGDRALAFLAHELRATTLLALGKQDDAQREIEALRALALSVARPVATWYVGGFETARALCEGRFDEAETLIAKSLDAGQRAGHPGAVILASAQGSFLALARRHMDRYLQGLMFFRQRYPWAERAYRTGLAFAHAEAGRVEEAKREIATLAPNGFEDLPRDEHWMTTLVMSVVTCRLIDDKKRSRQLYTLLEPFAERTAFHDRLRLHSGSIHRFLGLCAQCIGEFDTAIAHFENAMVVNRELGARPYFMRTCIDLGSLLLIRGDVDRGRRLLRDGAAVADELGLRELAHIARATASKPSSAQAIIKPS